MEGHFFFNLYRPCTHVGNWISHYVFSEPYISSMHPAFTDVHMENISDFQGKEHLLVQAVVPFYLLS